MYDHLLQWLFWNILRFLPKCFPALFILKAVVLKRILTSPIWLHTLSLSLTHSVASCDIRQEYEYCETLDTVVELSCSLNSAKREHFFPRSAPPKLSLLAGAGNAIWAPVFCGLKEMFCLLCPPPLPLIPHPFFFFFPTCSRKVRDAAVNTASCVPRVQAYS